MPVTAKLSRRFYDHFGDEITNELVDWMNSVDATYQTGLRELNEINFARFDAKLEQRVAAVENRIDMVETRLDAKIAGVEKRLEAKIDDLETRLEAKIDGVEKRLDANIHGVEQRLEARIDGVEKRLDARIDGVEKKLDATMEAVKGLDARMSTLHAQFVDRLATSESRMLRWMVGLWTSSILATVGLLVTVLRSR